MFEFSRRGFLSRVSLGFLSFYSWQGGATEWPKPPPATDAAPAEKLPPFANPDDKPEAAQSQPLPLDQRIGFAVVGLGRLAIEEILPAFAQSKMCRVRALVSGDRKKAERLAAEYGVAPEAIYSYSDFDRIAAQKDVQVVYVVLPNSLHREFTERGAAAGKHVLCEKPMTTSVTDAEAMIAACRNHGVKLMIAYRQQYEPNNTWVRKLLRERQFGKLKIFEASNFQNQSGQHGGAQQWRHHKALAGGGALPDIGLYCLNAARFLSGEEPVEVSAMAYSTPGDPRFKEVEEAMTWQMRFASGWLAVCSCSYGAHDTKRYRWTCERGACSMDPAFSYRGLKTEIIYSLGTPLEHHDVLSLGEANQFALEMDHMADCILHNKAPRTPGEEGLQDQRLMAAIYQSAQTRLPVKLG